MGWVSSDACGSRPPNKHPMTTYAVLGFGTTSMSPDCGACPAEIASCWYVVLKSLTTTQKSFCRYIRVMPRLV